MSEAVQLLADNAALAAEIEAVKLKMGLSPVKEEQDRILAAKCTSLAGLGWACAGSERGAVFNMYDRDHDGYITRSEFEQLAYDCGVDMIALTEESISLMLNRLSLATDGRTSFSECAQRSAACLARTDECDRLAMQLLRLAAVREGGPRQA
jgi:hypothetical protein